MSAYGEDLMKPVTDLAMAGLTTSTPKPPADDDRLQIILV
jgi:hypothetical protein